jgi:uncharacterized protein Veg
VQHKKFGKKRKKKNKNSATTMQQYFSIFVISKFWKKLTKNWKI